MNYRSDVGERDIRRVSRGCTRSSRALKLLGWSPESWITAQDWADRMHPEDRQWVVDDCVAQSKAGVDHEADYRALNKDGSYVWIRDVVHLVPHERSVAPTVSVSVGLGTIIPSVAATPARFIEDVDKSLYQAKQRGRNCVVGRSK